MKHVLFVVTALLSLNCLSAQYTVNGNATRDNCHCYSLTPNSFTQSGSVWNNFRIDLNQSFDFNFNINLGCDDAGADGIVFVLQPISTSVGTTGGGLGFEGVSPSVGVTLDTWQNTDHNDPAYDHIAIQLNGNINHSNTATNIAGPITILPGTDNIEDCQWHTLRIKWDVTTKELTAFVDGTLRVNVARDFVTDVFGGNPQVFWGFTGSTGGARNLQQFCTALSPKFTFSQGQKRCINEPVTFFDSTVSFTALQKRYWDFGDGSNIDSVSINPVHIYPVAGDYSVKQTAIAADGCVEINTQIVRIGSIPIAAIGVNRGCINTAFQISDSSKTDVGTINQWNWNLGDAGASILQNPAPTYNNTGTQTIKLTVKSVEGCESAEVSKQVNIYPNPVADFDITGALCQKSVIQFTNKSTVTTGFIPSTFYIFGNGLQSIQPNSSTRYDTAKDYSISLTAITENGCLQTKRKTISILPIPFADFKFTAAGCSPVTLNYIDSSYTTDGTVINSWWWNLGNGNTSILQNPPAVYQNGNNIAVAMQVKNSSGCLSDTVKKTINLQSKPVAKFGSASIFCEGTPVQFSDSSAIASGRIKTWQWLLDNVPTGTEQNPSVLITPGNHTVRLMVTNETGCTSDPAVQNILINPKPVIDIQFMDACKDSTVNFKGIDISGNVQNWQWDFGNNSFGYSRNTQHIYNAAGTYKLSLTAVTANGCTNMDSSFITVYSTKAFLGNDTIIAASNQPIQLNAAGGVSYDWLPADGLNNHTIANPVAINTESRLYIVKAYTPAGCATYDTVLIRVFNGPEIYVPTAFNPGSTAGNSILKPIAAGISQFKNFTVYNRYGQVLFSTADPFRGWDGSYRGKPQNSDVYVWIASGITFRGSQISRRGTVMLIR